MDEPLELCLRIIELRQYARIKEAVDKAGSEDAMPTGPLADLAFEIEGELFRESQARRAAAAAEQQDA